MNDTSKALEYRHISWGVNEFLQYVDGRRDGSIKPLKCGSPKVNAVLMDGFDWGKIVCIAGRSGSGKSFWLEQLKREFIQHNPKNFKILSFEFEMLIKDQVSRQIQSKVNKSTKQLYSAGGNKVTDEDFEDIKSEAHGMNDDPIWYVDSAGSSIAIKNTIVNFSNEFQKPGEGLIVTLDHAKLVKMVQGQKEREMLSAFCSTIIDLKKQFDHAGKKLLIMFVSQLNRNIMDKDRILNKKLHYPNPSDLFGSDELMQACDNVFVIHNPSTLKLESYGPSNLPIFNPQNTKQKMLYIHPIKSRFGDSDKVLAMKDNFANGRVEEYHFPKDEDDND